MLPHGNYEIQGKDRWEIHQQWASLAGCGAVESR